MTWLKSSTFHFPLKQTKLSWGMLKTSSEECPKIARHKWLLPEWEEHNRDVWEQGMGWCFSGLKSFVLLRKGYVRSKGEDVA